MTQAEYNTHVLRCAQSMLALTSGDHAQAKAHAPHSMSGMRHHVVGSIVAAINVLATYSTHPHAADASVITLTVTGGAWQAHIANVIACIDTL